MQSKGVTFANAARALMLAALVAIGAAAVQAQPPAAAQPPSTSAAQEGFVSAW